MILAAAQTNPKDGDVEQNLMDHYDLIIEASDRNVDLIVFPEMSLTGYVREEAQELAFTLADTRLKELRQLSVERNVILIVGAPVFIDYRLFIGSFIIKPDHTISVYTKQYLHEGEGEFFESSYEYNPLIELKGHRITLAICADIENPKHPADASVSETTVYVPSIFYSKEGIDNAHLKLSYYACKYSMNILMSNYCGSSYGWDSGGKSGFWDCEGKLISSLNESETGLLVCDITK